MYINQFLNGNRSIRLQSSEESNSNQNLLCTKCFDKINDYDLACMTAARLHHELKLELSKTEAIYAIKKNLQNNEINEPELIIGMPLDSDVTVEIKDEI